MRKVFESPRGAFALERHDARDHRSLQAWDAADEYLLTEVEAEAPLLVVNDAYGALSAAFAEFRPCLLTDSFRTVRTTARNLALNGIPGESVRILTPFDTPEELFSLCLVKIPKSLSLLDFELARIRGFLASGARIVGAGMTRDIHTSTVNIFETRLGPAVTSPARKKARLVLSRPEATDNPHSPATEVPRPKKTHDPETGLSFAVYGGVFSREGIDRGTRFLLANLPGGEPRRIVDLGCGSGVIGLAAALRYPSAELSLTDESFLAVESSRETFRLNGLSARARFLWGDGLEAFDPDSADLILCNPPFHENRAVSLSPAFGMFADARRVLRRGGELRLVANNHLGYEKILSRIFPNSAIILKSARYALFSCRKE